MPGPVEQRWEGKERERERGEESLKKKKEKEYNITNSEHTLCDITMCLKGPQDVKTAASMQTESN